MSEIAIAWDYKANESLFSGFSVVSVWGHLGPLWSLCRPFWALLEPFWSFFEPFGDSLGYSGRRLGTVGVCGTLTSLAPVTSRNGCV